MGRRTALVAGVLVLGCTTVRQPVIHPTSALQALAGRPDTLKVHHRSGIVDVLGTWSIEGDSVLAGTGVRYSQFREVEGAGTLRTPIDSIALLESNNPRTRVSAGMVTLGIWAVFWGGITASCVADPKACFGSCPTFYVDDVDADRPLAEGFSSSIARSLEAQDIDDLGLTRPGGSVLRVRMTNEAWETHMVRRVRLFALPVEDGATVHATADGVFRRVRASMSPVSCGAGGRDCAPALAARDPIEWHTPTDAADLAARDTLELVYAPRTGELGLVLAARQSFVSTFVLYQTMAYLGTNAGPWLARLERGDPAAVTALNTMNAMIGAIEVTIDDGAGWRHAATYTEAGPIATDVQLLPLGARTSSDSVRVRLVFAKGNWRIGQATLGVIGDVVQPAIIEPAGARWIGKDGASVRADLLATNRYVTTLPDDAVSMRFDLPTTAPAYSLFLESQGYYYEWMRRAWLAEEDPRMAAMLMLNPGAALREMAPAYKAREADFERSFWTSRFGHR